MKKLLSLLCLGMNRNVIALLVSIAFLSCINPARVNAQVANALNFDGIDDYVDISPLIPYSSNFTLEAWIKTSSGSAVVYGRGNPTVNGYLYFGLNVGLIRLAIGDGVAI